MRRTGLERGRFQQGGTFVEKRGRLLDLGVSPDFNLITGHQSKDEIENFRLDPEFQIVLVGSPELLGRPNPLAGQKVPQIIQRLGIGSEGLIHMPMQGEIL